MIPDEIAGGGTKRAYSIAACPVRTAGGDFWNVEGPRWKCHARVASLA